MKNRIIQSLVEHNKSVFWQTKDQNMAIENTPSKNVIVSNLGETVSSTYHFGRKTECKWVHQWKCFRHTKEQYSRKCQWMNECPINLVDAVD